MKISDIPLVSAGHVSISPPPAFGVTVYAPDRAGKGARVAVVTKRGHVDWPVWNGSCVVWDFPERVPRYMKAAALPYVRPPTE